MPLKIKLFIPLLGVALLGGIFLTTFWLPHNQNLLTQDHKRLLSIQLENISESITSLLLEQDLGGIYASLDALRRRNKSWLSLKLYDEQGRLTYPLENTTVTTNQYIHRVTHPIRYKGTELGRLEVVADFTDRHLKLEAQRRQLIAALFGGVLILGIVATLAVEMAVRRPVGQLTEAADRLMQGDYDAPLPPHDGDEVGQLIKRFGVMREAIRHHHHEIEHQFQELQEAQQELTTKNRQIVSILENTTDAYLALERDLRFTYINAHAERLLDTSGDKILGQNIWDSFPELGSYLYKPLLKLLVQDEPVETEVYYPPSDLWLECHLAPTDAGVAMYLRDITERKQAEQVLRKSEENQRAILQSVADGIITSDARGTILSFNPAAETIFGYTAEEAIGAPLSILMDDDMAKDHAGYLKNYQHSRKSDIIGVGRELTAKRKDGSLFPMEIAVTEMWLDNGVQFVGIVRDITARKRSEEQLRLAEKIFESNSEGIVVTDKQTNILRVNAAFRRITGYDTEEVVGKTPKLLSSGKHDKLFYGQMWHDLLEHGHWQGEIWNRRKSGETYPEWLSLSAVYDDDNSVSNFVAIFSDITDKKAAEERIRHMAHHDALTGLLNRTMFNMELGKAIARALRDKQQLAVLYLDLDHFKKVNDTLGHPVGDEMLKVIASRLTGMLRDTDLVCRIGGDEFIVMLRNTKKTQHVSKVVQNLIQALSHPIELVGRELFIGTSVGVALYPQDATSGDELIKNADAALFRAKELGRNNYQFYSQEMNAKAVERLELETKLRRALEREEFVLHYQPQLDLRQGRVIGVEALVRWDNRELGLVSPAEFIPLLEDTGLIVPVGEWILRHACQRAKAWQQDGLGDIRIAVNIAPRQFLYSDIVATVAEVLRDTQLAPQLLELEITEGSIMVDADSNIHRLQQLADMGVQLAIDDFGTGYSSLAYLKRFPIDALKIDQSFVRDMHVDMNDANIVAAVIALGQNLGLRVIAEGVEEVLQLQHLRHLGCQEAQGYYISRPMPETKLRTFLAEHTEFTLDPVSEPDRRAQV
jgi:diguanylate cyclase (GGDEF)-like protein/PAS domain S-box-containing protein